MVKIKNIEKVDKRLKKAIDKKEKIVLYGDADLDGTCSVVILQKTLEIAGAQKLTVYFPDRTKEGYGLNIGALNFLEEKIKDKFVLIILDSGITNFSEVKEARKRGIEVIIIDHHQPLNKLPKASLIVDPKQKGDKYPFKNFSNAGLVFKLAEEFFQNDFDSEIKSYFLELAALATISDMMEQADDNEVIIKEGLESLENTKNIGLKTLKNIFSKGLPIREISQQMISILNAGEVVDHKTESYNLLVSKTESEAQTMVEGLIKRSEEKHRKINLMMIEIEKKTKESDHLVFEGSQKWDVPLLGAVASKICHKTKKPVFLLRENNNYSRGAVRVPSGINAVDVMKKYSNLLESFGGHPPAAGFNIKNENIDKFKNKLKNHFKKI